MIDRLLKWPSRRGICWIVVVVSLLLAGASGPLAGKFEAAQKNDIIEFLPDSADSTKVALAQQKMPGADTASAAIIVRRDGGLLPEDRQQTRRLRLEIQRKAPPGAVLSPLVAAQNNDALLFSMIYPARRLEAESLVDTLVELRKQVAPYDKRGLEVRVGGQLGFAADAIRVFRSINSTLLIATALLVLVLLLIIYRSPIFWTLPMLSVLVAEGLARGGGYLLTELGVTVNGQSAGILSVLVFGAGTDYALLLVARYREELRRTEAAGQAAAIALQRTGPTILASGSTVIAGLLCLQLAEVNALAGLGPSGAVGIAAAMISSLTLLPALLAVTGRRAFWPLVPKLGSAGPDHGPWRRIGQWIDRHRRSVLVAGTLLLALLSLGLTEVRKPLSSNQGFRNQVESLKAQTAVQQSFPAGASAPSLILVPEGRDEAQVRKVLNAQPQVAAVNTQSLRGPPGTLLAVTLRSAPASEQAMRDVQALRKVLARTGALIGGSAAQETDLRAATWRDTWKLVPLITLLVLLILIVLLRSVVMPILLVGTVVLSFAASLGAVSWISIHMLGAPGIAPSLPIITFVFLVALGVDYNIFLAARAREERAEHDARTSMLRALAVTGAVITSAGIVLAGTFSVLTVLPLWSLTEIGLAVAFGVLLDTILVRCLLVPAASLVLGERAWWPR